MPQMAGRQAQHMPLRAATDREPAPAADPSRPARAATAARPAQVLRTFQKNGTGLGRLSTTLRRKGVGCRIWPIVT